MVSENEYPGTLSQEEMDYIILDARAGEMDNLKEIFTEISPALLKSIKDTETSSTPIHMAAGNGHIDIVKYLLSLLPKEDAEQLAARRNSSGNTALHWAALNGHNDVVKVLADQYKVDVFSKNEAGRDALFEAENGGHQDMVNWMLKEYAVEDQIKVQDTDEDTRISYVPGNESKEAQEKAQSAAYQHSTNQNSPSQEPGTQNSADQDVITQNATTKNSEELSQKTKDLEINDKTD